MWLFEGEERKQKRSLLCQVLCPLEISGNSASWAQWDLESLGFGSNLVLPKGIKCLSIFPLKYYKLFQIFFLKKTYHCPSVLRLKSQQDSACICFGLCDCACSQYANSLGYMQAWNIVRFTHSSFWNYKQYWIFLQNILICNFSNLICRYFWQMSFPTGDI